MQTTSNKNNAAGSQKDLWLVIREGSLEDVDLALARLKKIAGNVNSRNLFGLTPLHVATWRNHVPIVRRLLSAGADPDTRDGESGWSSLHRALHFGHLAVAGILLQSGASTSLEDTKFRIPTDLLSCPVLQAIGDGHSSATEVFSWGSGANYQLGTGNEHVQKLPCKVDALQGSYIKLVSAAKFHSVAVGSNGEVYTWGFGRGGRLGHADFDIHSGQAAVITPQQVICGLGSRRVKAIAAAKHHTVLATEGGEVFTWGSNREGQLGYIVDTQPTPRRVSYLKSRIVAVAAANKHTAAVSDVGEVFTWGCNREGQLGYGTSNSASNYNPRVVDYLKGKNFRGVSAAKHHTVVLGADGEVYSWGHKVVTPKRVVIARNLKKSGSSPLKFHRWERLHVVAVAAGMMHSLALTDDGALFYWVSADPDLKSQQLYSMYGKPIVSISSGKYWSSIVTATGDVYMWDGKMGKNEPPYVTRLHGVKKATSVSVGETHLLIVSALYHPAYSPGALNRPQQEKLKVRDEAEELDDCSLLDETESGSVSPAVDYENFRQKPVPSLKSLCEKVAAENLVELRNVMQMLEIAHSFGADDLRKYCEDIAIHNLDYILAVASHSFSSASPEILAHLEHVMDERSSEPWNNRKLPTQTAILPVIIDSEQEESEHEFLRTRDKRNNIPIMKNEGDQRSDFFLRLKEHPDQDISKKVRALWKKLQQIEMLEAKQSDGHDLDHQQLAKLQTRSAIEDSLADLGFPVETTLEKVGRVVLPHVKSGRKTKQSKKYSRNKGKMDHTDTIPSVSGTDIKVDLARDFSEEVSVSQVSMEKEDDIVSEASVGNGVSEDVSPVQKKDILVAPLKCKSPSPLSSKKKTRKGGLSMFLSGALDDVPKVVTPPPMPRTEGPAWGGAKVSKGSASLREIQDEQRRLIMEQPVKNKDQTQDQNNQKNGGKVSLASFLPSKPKPVVSASTSQPSDAERATASWASGTPPHLSRASLRDIQIQQEQKQQRLTHVPKTQTTGFSVASGQGSPSDSLSMSRWFQPEVEVPSSIRSIQIEEKAMKDLKRFYSSVKIVRKST